jgi:hypothetical protein
MSSTPAPAPALWRATLVGTLLQVAMVVGGHYQPALKAFYAPGGMLFSAVAGWLFGRFSATPRGMAAIGGIVAGAACAFLGILESYYLRDVPASLLVLGTLSSAVTGAIGGALGGRSRA